MQLLSIGLALFTAGTCYKSWVEYDGTQKCFTGTLSMAKRLSIVSLLQQILFRIYQPPSTGAYRIVTATSLDKYHLKIEGCAVAVLSVVCGKPSAWLCPLVALAHGASAGGWFSCGSGLIFTECWFYFMADSSAPPLPGVRRHAPLCLPSHYAVRTTGMVLVVGCNVVAVGGVTSTQQEFIGSG
jgi:hypothetical protein